jgi:cell division protein FtsW
MQTQQKQKKPLFYKHRPDYMITVLVLVLVGIGLMMIYSTGWISILKQTAGTSDNNIFFASQLTSLLIGGLGWLIASKINYHFWQKYAGALFLASVILMFLVLVPNIAVNGGGASRWVKIGFINFQPVEFFKLGTVIFMAAWLNKHKNNQAKVFEGLIPFMIIIAVIVIPSIILQKDMGSAMVIILTVLSMYFVSGVPWWNMTAASLVLIGGGMAMAILTPYRFTRLLTFMNHTEDIIGAGYHINQALIALGSGGLFGRGLGKSLQAYGYLPEATNDSIFAIIGEEFGLLGASGIIMAFSLLVWRGMRIARSTADDFGKLLAVGISCWIGFQALINISAMLNLIPLTGIPLPFISYGGTSLLALLVAIGILQNISKYTYKEVYYEDSGSRRRDGRAHIAGVGRSRINSQT